MKLHRTILLCSSLLTLGGCTEALMFKATTGGIMATANDVFARPDVNLKEKNYAAADFLAQQMQVNVDRNAIIVAQRLVEADSPEMSSPLGYGTAREVGLRLIDLGYNVYVHEVQDYGPNGLYPSPSRAADYTLTGTYFRATQEVDVKLRLIDNRNGRVVARYEYPLLLSREVREAVKTPTRIFHAKNPL